MGIALGLILEMKDPIQEAKTCTPDLPSELGSKVRIVQLLTIAWMSVELAIAIAAGVRAHSIALTAFGTDSGVELLSAVVVLRRFRSGPGAEKMAARINAALLYALGVYILCTSGIAIFSNHLQPETSVTGIVLLIAASIIMPVLGAAKKRLAISTQSGALKADAAQSNLCAYMAWIALAGLVVNALFHLPWADSAAALFLLPLVLREANEARKGEICEC